MGLRRPAVGATSSQRTLLLRQGPLRGQRCMPDRSVGACCAAASEGIQNGARSREQLRRDVAVGARSIAGQVGVAAVEEIVEAQQAELMSFAALPRHLMKQRDSLLSLQNVESLTDELAQLSQDLERLSTSDGASTSESPVSTAFDMFTLIYASLQAHGLWRVRDALARF